MVDISIPQGTELVYISFSARINPNTSEALIGAMAVCANRGVRQVHLLLSTPGGSVMNGMNVHHVLKGMPFELVTHNVGNIDSIGNLVFLAGSRRYTVQQATFMFHGVGFNVGNATRFEEKYLRERLESLMSDQRRIGDVIAQNSTLTKDEVAGLFLRAQTMDANWALDKRIVHEIRDVQIPSGTPVISLSFQS
jgi:ATP-dependent Clp protease protease subunit